MKIAVCADIAATELSVTSSSGMLFWRQDRDWWAANAAGVEIEKNTVLTADSVSTVFTEVTLDEPIDLDEIDTLTVEILSNRPELNIVSVFPFGDGEPWEDGWVHPDGTVTAEPCE